MRVLALDTTTRAGSVAIVDDDRVVARAQRRSRRAPTPSGCRRRSAGRARRGRLRDVGVDLFAIASGPGSFTGLRVGIATIQGLAFVRTVRASSPSLRSRRSRRCRERRAAAGTIVGAWMDAHRREVFSALYRVAGAPLYSARARLDEIERAGWAHRARRCARWSDAGHPPVDRSSETARRCTRRSVGGRRG